MKKRIALVPVVALGLVVLACSDSSSPSSPSTGGVTPPSLSTAFNTLPLRFSLVPSSFSADAGSDTTLWRPGGEHDSTGPAMDRDGREGRDGRGGMFGQGFDNGLGNGGIPGEGGMMCGGLGGPFGGAGFDLGFGRGLHGARLPSNCVFDASSGRVNCPPDTTERGVIVVRSAAYTDTAGTAQSKFDSLTNTINLRVDVTGTILRRDGDTSTVAHHSDRTVAGLVKGSTQRTVNATTEGQETTKGSDSTGTFIAVRMIGDTITGVVIPVPPVDTTADRDDDDAGIGHGEDEGHFEHGRPPFPTAGTIVRTMTVTVTRGAAAPTISSRREMITYNGDGTATVVITKDGTTKTCTINADPHGRPVCQ